MRYLRNSIAHDSGPGDGQQSRRELKAHDGDYAVSMHSPDIHHNGVRGSDATLALSDCNLVTMVDGADALHRKQLSTKIAESRTGNVCLRRDQYDKQTETRRGGRISIPRSQLHSTLRKVRTRSRSGSITLRPNGKQRENLAQLAVNTTRLYTKR